MTKNDALILSGACLLGIGFAFGKALDALAECVIAFFKAMQRDDIVDHRVRFEGIQTIDTVFYRDGTGFERTVVHIGIFSSSFNRSFNWKRTAEGNVIEFT